MLCINILVDSDQKKVELDSITGKNASPLNFETEELLIGNVEELRVSKALDVSEPTVYRYINKIK